jgi:tetratricopeptide (TPR) repeat protein
MIRRKSILALLVSCIVGVSAPVTAQSGGEANAAWVRGDLPTAERLYLQILQADSTEGSALHRLALMRAWAERHDESITLFDRLLRHEPSNLDARVDRARVLAWRGDQGAAATALDSVLAVQPRFVPALVARAQLVSWQGSHEEALEIYGRALEVNPADRDARTGRARVLSWAADYEGAVAAFDSLVRSDPRDVEALVGLGNVLVIAERTDSARAVFARALAIDPRNADALAGVARAAAYAGDLRGSEEQWRQLIELSPDHTDARVGLAQTLRWQGREAAAIAVLEEALRGEPGHAEARAQLRQSQLALASSIRPMVVYESDSDQNRITSFSVSAGVRVQPRLELGGEGYVRTADYEPATAAGTLAFGGAATFRLQVEPGWEIAGALGASGTEVGGPVEEGAALGGSAPLLRASLTTPGLHPWRASVQASWSALDATWALIRNGVEVKEVSVSSWGSLAGWRTSAGVSAASFRSGASGQSNRRIAGNASISRRFRARWTLGVSARAFGFQKDLFDGYFDPDLYAIAELPLQWDGRSGRWSAEALVAPGLQQVGSEGEAGGTFRTQLALTRGFASGRNVTLVATYSKAGVNQLAALDASDYDYFSLALRSNLPMP